MTARPAGRKVQARAKKPPMLDFEKLQMRALETAVATVNRILNTVASDRRATAVQPTPSPSETPGAPDPPTSLDLSDDAGLAPIDDADLWIQFEAQNSFYRPVQVLILPQCACSWPATLPRQQSGATSYSLLPARCRAAAAQVRSLSDMHSQKVWHQRSIFSRHQ